MLWLLLLWLWLWLWLLMLWSLLLLSSLSRKQDSGKWNIYGFFFLFCCRISSSNRRCSSSYSTSCIQFAAVLGQVKPKSMVALSSLSILLLLLVQSVDYTRKMMSLLHLDRLILCSRFDIMACSSIRRAMMSTAAIAIAAAPATETTVSSKWGKHDCCPVVVVVLALAQSTLGCQNKCAINIGDVNQTPAVEHRNTTFQRIMSPLHYHHDYYR